MNRKEAKNIPLPKQRRGALGLGLCVGLLASSGCGDSADSELSPSPDGGEESFPDAGAPSSPHLVDISLGDAHGCVLVNDGRVACWGENSSGQLGDGSITNRRDPVYVEGLDDAIAVFAGGYYTCAIHEDETVSCWGDNFRGNLGIGSFETRLTPTPVPGLTNVKTMALSHTLGRKHTCAVVSDGSLWCWGTNLYGAIGTGQASEADIVSPVQASVAGTNVTGVANGYDWTCASSDDGSARCWGRDYWNVLGHGGTGDVLPGFAEAVLTPIAPVVELSDVLSMSNGGIHSCALQENQRGRCLGPQHSGQLGAGASDTGSNHAIDVDDIHYINAGGSFTCMIAGDDREVICLGANYYGQCGSPSQEFVDDFGYIYSPTKVPGLEDVDVLSSGDRFSCVLTNGELKCWGSNVFGQLGASFSGEFSETPLRIDLSNLNL